MFKTVELKGGWEPAYIFEDAPFGVEMIAPGDWVIFRLLGNSRMYLRDTGFKSKKQALTYLEGYVRIYKGVIITALEGEE